MTLRVTAIILYVEMFTHSQRPEFVLVATVRVLMAAAGLVRRLV